MDGSVALDSKKERMLWIDICGGKSADVQAVVGQKVKAFRMRDHQRIFHQASQPSNFELQKL